MTGEQKPGGLEVVAKVVSAFGDPEAFGERDIEVVADMSRIPYETRLTPAEPAEARIRELVDQLLKTERDYSELRQSYDAVVAKLTTERAHGDKQYRRATDAEAKLARAVEGLRRIGYGDGGIGTHRAIAQQTLAALQQEGE
jgi:hypothetical protein